jgi:hypothetical protein
MVNEFRINNDILIPQLLSPDNRFVIFLDELYDIKTKKNLGNIWENFENLKFFLRYSFNNSELDKNIVESANKILNGHLITESVENILDFKPYIKEYLNEGVWENFKKWTEDTGKSTVNGFKEFLSKTKKGASQIVDKISNSDWVGVIDLLKKGIHFFAKNLRDAMYSPVGIVLDTILIVSGIGKSVQWIPWAIIVALDIYELIKGDYESLFDHLLSTFFDILGLVFTGAVAKGAKLLFKGAKNADQINKVVTSNPNLKKYFQKLPEILSKISPKLQSAIKYLSGKFPKAANFIKSILSGLDKLINKMINEFKKLLKPSVAIAGATSAGITAGIGILTKDSEGVSDTENDTEIDFGGLETLKYDFTGQF